MALHEHDKKATDEQEVRDEVSPQEESVHSSEDEKNPNAEAEDNINASAETPQDAEADGKEEPAENKREEEEQPQEEPVMDASSEQPEGEEVSEVTAASNSDVEGSTESTTAGEGESDAHPTKDGEGADQDHQDHDEEHHLDYSGYSKTQLVQAIESQLKNTDMSEIGKILKEIKPAFDDIHEHEKEEAFQRYLEEGGDKDGFEYKGDELDSRFLEAYNKLRDQRHHFYNDLEKQKDQNLAKKQAVLEKLREIVDSDETVASMKELKDIQDEWKATGPVAPQHLKSLWANYNALIDRFYDKRSIYFELKELDRKKNLEAKLELCEKAEKLEGEDIKEAIKQLNELHEEFKHIGPVPKEDQEAVWKRFKTASDAVYARRKEYYESLKEDLKMNQMAKESLAEKVQMFVSFDSEKISDWNHKTKEILELQKQWEAIGGLPRETAKKINKQFWSAFKTFFNHKGQFFKKIEKARQENLKLKEELVAQAEALKDSEDFAQTAEKLKELQRNWKDIGPVPEKFRNEIYNKFKAACDHFFNRKRQGENSQEKDYVENLKKKEALCEEIEKMTADNAVDLDKLDDILEEWGKIGFVPKHDIKRIQERYLDAISGAAEKTDLDEEAQQRLRYMAQFSKLKSGPNAQKIIQKKENSLRRQIAKLENDIDLWKNNLNFFAESKTADKLKQEFNEKIDKATEELHDLEEQLRAISNF